jgi:hypothetical protein
MTAKWITASEVARQVLVVLAEPAEATQPRQGPPTTHFRGTTANRDTTGGSTPGGSQRRRRPLSWRWTTSKAPLDLARAHARNPPR